MIMPLPVLVNSSNFKPTLSLYCSKTRSMLLHCCNLGILYWKFHSLETRLTDHVYLPVMKDVGLKIRNVAPACKGDSDWLV